MSKVVLGVDIETSGIDPKKDFITEIGYVLHDFETNTEIVQGSILVNAPLDDSENGRVESKKLSEEIVNLTGITDKMLLNYGIPLDDATSILLYHLGQADFIAAHNCSFEQDFLTPQIYALAKFDWIDTRIDINWPSKLKTRKLTYLASEHGIFVKTKHRAVADVQTMLELMGLYDFDEIVKFSKSPLMKIKADVGFSRKDLAKEAGFYFEPKTKEWLMDIKEISFVALRDSVKFNILIMG